MLKILAAIGMVLLVLLLLLVWFILVPRSVFVEYTKAGGVTVKVRLFGFKVKVYPFNLTSNKKDKPEKKKAKKAKQQKPEQKNKKSFDIKEKLPQGMELVKTVLSAVKGVGRILLKGISVKDVSFTLPITAGNAYATQKQYAEITTAFYGFSVFLQKYVKFSCKSPIFIADFANLYADSTYFYCKIQASPSIMLSAGWYLFKIYKNLDKENINLTEEK